MTKIKTLCPYKLAIDKKLPEVNSSAFAISNPIDSSLTTVIPKLCWCQTCTLSGNEESSLELDLANKKTQQCFCTVMKYARRVIDRMIDSVDAENAERGVIDKEGNINLQLAHNIKTCHEGMLLLMELKKHMTK